MGTVLCFISDQFADFEVTLALHKIRNVAGKQVLTAGYSRDAVMSESGLWYKPDIDLEEAARLDGIEALLIPGGPLREQQQSLTELIVTLDGRRTLLAAICNGPQYLGRAGILARVNYTTSCPQATRIGLGEHNPFPPETYTEQRVVRDGHVITAKGRAFVDFSFALFDYLDVYGEKPEERNRLLADILGNDDCR